MSELIGADEGLVTVSAEAPNGEQEPLAGASSLSSHHVQLQGCDQARPEDSTGCQMKGSL